jgi:lipopolysaccharide export system permease protein
LEGRNARKRYPQTVITRLDRHIIKRFLGTYFFMLVLVMSISVMFDISEKMEDFTTRDVTLKQILLDYYLNFILYYSNLFSALFIFLAVLLFTSKMAKNTEIVPILSSGVSFRRFLRPYFIAATMLAVFSLVMNHFVIPPANRTRLEFEKLYTNSAYVVNDMYKETDRGTVVFFKFYSSTQGFLQDFWLTRRDPETGRIQQVLHAEQAFGDSLSQDWRLERYFIREFTPGQQEHQFRMGQSLDTVLEFSIAEFTTKAEIASAMSYFELRDFIRREKERGSKEVPFYEIEMHQRSSYPIATYILTLIGVSISSRKSRDGYGRPIAMGIGLILLYIFGMKMTTVAAMNVGFNPLLAVWLPNMMFFGVAWLIYRRAPK